MSKLIPVLSSGYAFVSVACSEQVMVTDSECVKYTWRGTITIDDNEYNVFRWKDKTRLQLAIGATLSTIRMFYASDIVRDNHLYVDRTELVDCPLWYHAAGLSQTGSGYGSKLVSNFKIWYNGRLYRLYVTCWSNCASTWFIAGGRKIFVS